MRVFVEESATNGVVLNSKGAATGSQSVRKNVAGLATGRVNIDELHKSCDIGYEVFVVVYVSSSARFW